MLLYGKEKDENSAKKAFVTTLVSIVLSPLSVCLGFYLNDYLQKPKIAVDEISINYYLNKVEIPRSTVEKVKKHLLLVLFFKDDLKNTSGMDCSEWMKTYKTEFGCLRAINESVEKLRNILNYNSSVPRSAKDRNYNDDDLSSMNTCLADIDGIINSLAMEIPARSGLIDFKIGIINSGGSDGVVKSRGELSFDQGKFSLIASKYVVIKAHGFETVVFKPNFKTPDEEVAFKIWSNAIKDREVKDFTVCIETASGDCVRVKGETSKSDL